MSESGVVTEKEKQRKVLPALRLEREGRSSRPLVFQVEKGIAGLARGRAAGTQGSWVLFYAITEAPPAVLAYWGLHVY